ncbi:hypothetical protein [Capnocytophaga canis]|uniref:hypothetical protein n=1 Tax=Capnocytophaga canis TaxID=1848903 RepID=UPI001562350C|nr:hypothetical protein [Capnocytophaga canis]
MATVTELNQIINLIKHETQNEGNTKERVARALELLRDLDVWVKNQEGKSLSTNDFTNDYKQKLESLQNVNISGKLDKGSYSGTASELKQHLETLINNKVTQEPGKGLISDSEKSDIAENKKKRVVDFTITGDVDKIFTLIYNDGSTKAKNFTDIVGQSGADVMLNSLNFNKDTGVLTGVRSDGQQITVDLNGRFALLNHTHAWNDITGKPATFPPSPHTHVVNWNDVQNKPDLSQLGAKPVIKVTVDTVKNISVKVGTTTAGNYVPQEGDELSVEFKKGQTANNVTLNIDNSGEKKIVIGGAIANSRTLLVTDHKLDYKKMVRLWYDGENYQLIGSTYNSTYEVIHTTRLEDVQNQQPHLVSGKILAWVRNWANIIDKPDFDTILLKITGNINTGDLISNVPQKGKTIISQGTANIVVTVNSADGFVASYQKAGTGNITFQAGSGKTLVQVDGTNVINGVKGSTATVTVVGNEVLLRVSNV